ncbi:hypothetical protein G7054_g4821 [Neopestalotiopsis clavispora]|nr:hypothetical protein G7054_g4821 [Neopestalotiopsis clavispora]
MAEPVGIVGTAVGIISFGLQLYSAIATYIDALDGRKDDLALARVQLDSLRDSITAIQSALPSSPSGGTGTSTIPPIVTECKTELDQLEALLLDLVGSNTSGNKLKERIKTLKFPFRRDSLMKLEDRLHKTNSVFQTALSVLNLNKSIDNERRFANVETTTAQIPAINTNVVQISTDVQNLRVDVGNMSTNVNSAISTMNSNNNETLSRLDFSVTQLTATAGQSLPQISNSIASIEQRMQSLSALEERLRALSLLEQILGIQDAQVQATPQFALQRLLAKPRAGGFNISPNITLRPIIDESKSPVFRILNTLMWFLTDGSYTRAELSRSLRITKTTILGLYSQKKAFVNETTKTGESAISEAIDILTYISRSAPCSLPLQDLAEALSDTIVELVQAGLPANCINYQGL